jgi:hypothetical protein
MIISGAFKSVSLYFTVLVLYFTIRNFHLIDLQFATDIIKNLFLDDLLKFIFLPLQKIVYSSVLNLAVSSKKNLLPFSVLRH